MAVEIRIKRAGVLHWFTWITRMLLSAKYFSSQVQIKRKMVLRSDIASCLVVVSGLNSLYSLRIAGPGFPIMAYHEIRAEVLHAHIDALSSRFRLMSLEDAINCHNPDRNRPPLVLTFDDGYRSWLTEVIPVLRQRHIPALFFVCSGFADGATLPWYEVLDRYLLKFPEQQLKMGDTYISVRNLNHFPRLRQRLHQFLKSMNHADFLTWMAPLQRALSPADRRAIRSRYLTWDDIRSIADQGMDVGAHTQTHPILSRIDLQQLRNEVQGSKIALESSIQRRVRYFAYPNGSAQDMNECVVTEVRRAGFQYGLTALSGWNRPGVDPFLLRRAVAAPAGTIFRLRAAASGVLGRLEDGWRKIGG